jgi:polar amino acid transport system substrate-binding protein
MTSKISIVALIVAMLALLIVGTRPAGREMENSAVKSETAFERVMRTRTLRCGYALWSPVIYKDLKTGEIKGISRDIMDELGKKLDLRIEWTDEAVWGTIVEGLATKRYDMICNGLGVMATRARVINFSAPLFYTPIYLVVRADENRILKTEDVDNPAVNIAILDGDGFAVLAPRRFPKAVIKSLPQNSDWSAIFQEVETKKADVAGVDSSAFIEYLKTNPGKLKILDKSNPLFLFPVAFGLPQGDVALKTMIDAALSELFFDGTIAAALRTHASPEEFLMPVKPYAPPEPEKKGNSP